MIAATGEQVSVGLLSLALQAEGQQAVSYTGWQVPIQTDSAFTKARIERIDDARVRADLAAGKVVIITGFQGIDGDGHITTLGRGGSDTTAVALAAVLRADMCDIYTDVDGVFTTDPRIVPSARMMDRVSHDEMLELASLGAGEVSGDARICKVSIVGIGMKSHVGVAAKMFRTLAEEGINIQMITTSEIKTSAVIDEKYMELAVRALHKAFDLDQPQAA